LEELITVALLEDYFLYREKKNVPLKSNTKKQLTFAIQDFNMLMLNKYPKSNLRDLRQFHLEKYIDYLLNEKKLKESTITTKLNTLRSFFLFCIDNDLVEKDPFVGLESPKIPITSAPCITQEEWNKLLTAIKNSAANAMDSHRVARDLCILYILSYTACALEELVNLEIDDIDTDNSIITFKGTNKSHSRKIPLPKKINDEIGNYIKYHREIYTRAKSKNPSALFQASKTTFQTVVRKYSEESLGKRFNIEDIRASRINALITNINSVWAISEFIGIRDLTRLWRYIPEGIIDLKTDFENIKNLDITMPSFGNYIKSFHKRKKDQYLKKF